MYANVQKRIQVEVEALRMIIRRTRIKITEIELKNVATIIQSQAAILAETTL